jgi:hypothetical protein
MSSVENITQTLNTIVRVVKDDFIAGKRKGASYHEAPFTELITL